MVLLDNMVQKKKEREEWRGIEKLEGWGSIPLLEWFFRDTTSYRLV